MRINAAQQVLFALGVHFPLYSENKQGRRNATYTKKGPGRRHHTTEAEKVLRDSQRRRSTGFDVSVLNNVGTRCLTSHNWTVRPRGMWSLFIRSGKLYMRGFIRGPRLVTGVGSVV